MPTTGNPPVTDVSRHDDWIRVRGWADGRDTRTGRRYSSLGQTADFCASVRERYVRGGSIRGRTVCDYDWNVSRQRTEREGPDGRGQHWESYLAHGTAGTMQQARSEATKALRYLRARHIAAGGDVGYGDAPTGDQIRAYLASRTPAGRRRARAGQERDEAAQAYQEADGAYQAALRAATSPGGGFDPRSLEAQEAERLRVAMLAARSARDYANSAAAAVALRYAENKVDRSKPAS